MATKAGATNKVPSFITQSGPVREVRFAKTPGGLADGGVHGVFTIAGRTDAPGCTLQQPDFATAVANKNAVFRIPTPLFGAGLVEAIDDLTILNNMNANTAQKAARGISGHENRNANDGTMTRFGWKAQNKSLTIFTGEAYNVEQGVTNDVFPNERSSTPGCLFNATPEDHMNGDAGSANRPATGMSDIANFVFFMRFLSPPARGVTSSSTNDGQNLFSAIGCAFVPHAVAADIGERHQSPLQPDCEPLLRSDRAQHGDRLAGWRRPGNRIRKRVPHRAALGTGAYKGDGAVVLFEKARRFSNQDLPGVGQLHVAARPDEETIRPDCAPGS